MEWNIIKSNYPDQWYKLVDYLANPELYHERRIRQTGGRLAADTLDNSDTWKEVASCGTRDLYDFFEDNKIIVIILYNEWFGFYSYEIFSELRNEVSGKFDTRYEAETHAFMFAFDLLEKQSEII